MKIIILGDSTASIKEANKRPETGWGEKISLFLNDLQIVNLALNGRSTRSFIEEGHFDKALERIEADDLVIIQFGHNDQKNDHRYTSHFDTYQRNLNFMISKIKEKKGIVILLSSISRRYFIGKHRVRRYNIGLFPYVAKEVAKRNQIDFIDMFNQTKSLYEYLGDELSQRMFLISGNNYFENYPQGIFDNTHLNDYGAYVIASIVAKNLKKNKNTKISNLINDKKVNRVEVKRVLNDK